MPTVYFFPVLVDICSIMARFSPLPATDLIVGLSFQSGQAARFVTLFSHPLDQLRYVETNIRLDGR
jgi:hypothetical protein